jgi:Low-density lipoprotein receptor repeat class B
MMQRAVAATLIGLLVAASQAPAALGADSIYWGASSSDAVRVGNLDGTGSAQDLFSGENGGNPMYGPSGVAIDSAAGKIYWTDYANSGPVRSGNLAGGGAADVFTGESSTVGLAIDPRAGKLYWGNGSGGIRVGSVGGGSPQTLFQSQAAPWNLAIDPASGKVYWADAASHAIEVANLDGTGSPTPLFSGESSSPIGVAIDPTAGKIYWAIDANPGAIRVANLNGTGTPQTLFPDTYPFGVAVDPTAGKIYWSDDTNPNGTIRVGNLNGTGSPQTLFMNENLPRFLALLRGPVAAGAPSVSGPSSTGSVLSCSTGSWAPDLLGSFLYRVPQSFAYQWTLNGSDIAGATSSSYSAFVPGKYGCRVTASNHAGSATQSSAAFTVNGPAVPPRLTAVGQSHRRWREGSGLLHVARAQAPVGTTFRFRVDESVKVRFAFTQRRHGHRVTRGTLRFSVDARAHKVRFQGRLSKHKRLKPGRYALVITVTNAVGQHATKMLTFTIVKG